MPWSLEKRDGKTCVIKDSDGSVAGCHDSRTDAIKQQRALYANESRVASMYEELDAVEEEVIPTLEEKPSSELVKIEVGQGGDHTLTASILQTLDVMSERQQRTDEALVAALHQIAERHPVVNVEAPNVTVEPPEITVSAPNVTVEAAQAPNVTVNPEIVLPQESKTVKFLRDPFGRLEGAEVTE